MARLAKMGADLLSETLARPGEIKPVIQDHSAATFAPVLKKEDGMINWSAPADAIQRAIRGFQPWPNAYTYYKQNRLIIWDADVISPDQNGSGPHGEVIGVGNDGVIIRCGAGTWLRLLELQPEGKRRMSVADYLNGTRVRPGDQLTLV